MDNHVKNLDYLKKQIEDIRHKLIELINQQEGDLLDSDVIELSQILDQLIIEFERMKK